MRLSKTEVRKLEKIDPSCDTVAALEKIEPVPDEFRHGDNYLNSSVYMTTNEVISHYDHLFKNRKKMLSVVASGDQIFSAILAGVEEIDAFDISRFAKYFLYLKKAAIQALSPSEYIEFFHEHLDYNSDYISAYKDIIKNHFDRYEYIYSFRIREHLDKEALVFWDTLFSKYPWPLIRSRFSRTIWSSREFQEKNNKFLQPKYYQELGARFKDSRINFKTGNIIKLVDSYQSEYDLIYLSNIYNCVDRDEFRFLLNHLNTTPDGIILLGVVEGIMRNDPKGRCSLGDFDLRHVNGQPYRFTRHDGYLTGIRR
jgi:hypothetical protein